ENKEFDFKQLFIFFLVPSLIFQSTLVSSPIPEVPLLNLQIYMVLLFIDLMDDMTTTDSEKAKFNFFFIIFLSMVATTIKLSFLMFWFSISIMTIFIFVK